MNQFYNIVTQKGRGR